MVLLAAARDKVSPKNVPEKTSLTVFINFLRPANTDRGYPFAIPFPNVVKSGLILKIDCAPFSEYLNQ